MGFFKKNNGGIRCEVIDEGGTTHCQIFKGSNGEKVATGTDVVFNISPQNNCEPVYPNGFDVMYEDKSTIDDLLKQRIKACRKGIAVA